MAFEAYCKDGKHNRVILKESPEGVYVFVYNSPESTVPEFDHLQDDYEMAKLACEEDYGIMREAWREIPESDVP